MKRKLEISLLVWFVLLGAVSGSFVARHVPEPSWWPLISGLIASIVIFCWYRVDSIQKGFKRTFWLSVGVIAIAPLAIPLYVVQSNERGVRLRAVGRVLGYFCLVLIACVIGGVIGALIG
ncbi:hypothetical protein GTP56_18970 [Duganella sp. FT134W]|uniref:Uncharacterized protein n=1 Tax=Duganella margarita TaxID=2692170 RepID=A0A7X4H2T3_9BURK|nr:hypothetical protein [Duganella margarita]MYM74263.1 hypothetical protein [Duganella margarita]